jgi:hypothetical protein
MTSIYTHETKDNTKPIPDEKVVEAFGLRKCPKLIEQVAGNNLALRQAALGVVCDELRNPMSASSLAANGALPLLAQLLDDPDFITRARSARALAVAANDACGLRALLDSNNKSEEEGGVRCIEKILIALSDPSEEVRASVCECIVRISNTNEGAMACVDNGAANAIVDALKTWTGSLLSLRSLLLQALNQIASSEQGLKDALDSEAVQVCMNILDNDTNDTETISQAAKTLGFLCFDEAAKEIAIDCNGIPILFKLTHKQPVIVKAAVTMALMAITSTDEGKRQLLNGDGVDNLVSLLNEEDRIIRLNALKIVANAAVYPPIRERLLGDTGFMILLQRIKDGVDDLLKRHATIAIAAVQWKP